jgi:hypothetical protein
MVQPMDEELEDCRINIFQRHGVFPSFFGSSGESGAEELGLVGEELFVNNEAFLGFADNDCGELRIVFSSMCQRLITG